jgi:hypothetical protein
MKLRDTAELPNPRESSRHKIIDHLNVGCIALDCDVFFVAGDDINITVYTAEPGTEDADHLTLRSSLAPKRSLTAPAKR